MSLFIEFGREASRLGQLFGERRERRLHERREDYVLFLFLMAVTRVNGKDHG